MPYAGHRTLTSRLLRPATLQDKAVAMYDDYQAIKQQRDELQQEVGQLKGILAESSAAAGASSSGTPRSSHGGLIAHLRNMGGSKVRAAIMQLEAQCSGQLSTDAKAAVNTAAPARVGAQCTMQHACCMILMQRNLHMLPASCPCTAALTPLHLPALPPYRLRTRRLWQQQCSSS
jgi:hypothetical protein